MRMMSKILKDKTDNNSHLRVKNVAESLLQRFGWLHVQLER